METDARLRRAYRALLVLGGCVVGLLLSCGFLLATRGGETENRALYDPELRREAVAELIARGQGIWDAFPDPAVARVLQSGLKDRAFAGITIDSNDFGLRERPFQLPKPDGTTRVVILGDSVVMGYGVRAEDRVGVFLEKLLTDHANSVHGPIECLHFGVSTWNLYSECAFLRRQLSLVKPDLVVQIAVSNDLEDNPGARGMGMLSTWWPRFPERADSCLFVEWPRFAFGTRKSSWLLFGLDYESRSRFEEAGREIGRLARAVDQRGGRYLLFIIGAGQLATAQHYLGKELAPERSVPFPSSFNRDERFRNSKSDPHWNRAGHEQAALFLYELVRARNLLPALALEPHPAATEVVQRLLPEAEQELKRPKTLKRALEDRTISSTIDFRNIDDDAAAQVYGGIVSGGFVSAYASLLLRSEGRARLMVAGRGLDRSELDGLMVAVFIDATQVGTIAPKGADSFTMTFEVPKELAQQTFVSVRFQADDFAYALPDLRSCQTFILDQVALEN